LIIWKLLNGDEMELPSFDFQAKGWQLRADWKNRTTITPGRPEGLPRTAAITKNCEQKKAPQYAMRCDGGLSGFPDLIADFAATHKAYPFPV
jgi:hypothetical protein